MKIRVRALRALIREAITEADQVKCPECGASPRPNAKFCTKCGTKLPSSPKDDGAKKEVEKTISTAESLLAELEGLLSRSPDRPSEEERRLHDEIMGAYYEEQDKLLEVDPETPQEAREHIKKAGEHLRKFKPTMIKFYKAVKDSGNVLSRPVVELLITSLKREVEHEKSLAAQAAANKKRMDDAAAEFEKRMAAMNAEFEKKMAELEKMNPNLKIFDDAMRASKKK